MRYQRRARARRVTGGLVSAAIVSAFALTVAGCKHPPAAPEIQLVAEPPVPAPPSLIVEGTLRDPDAFWGRVRAGGGPLAADAPATAAGAILRREGIDPTLSRLANGAQPFYIAIGYGPSGTQFAIAMGIGDFDAARAAMGDSDAGFTTEALGTMIHLVPPGGEHGVAVAVARSGFLVLASNVEALGTLGPYAARTLPTKPPAASSLQLRAVGLAQAATLAPALATKLSKMIAANLRSSLPEEVDANALMACFTPSFQESIAAWADLDQAHLDVDDDGAQLHATGTSVPKAGANAARARIDAMHPASATPLFDAPRESAASLFWSDTAEARADDAKTFGPCVARALGPILGGGGAPKLEGLLAGLLASWARGRGDWETMSVLAKGRVAGLVVRAALASEHDASAAFDAFSALSSEPALQSAIRGFLPSRAGGGAQSVEVPSVGTAKVIMFAPSVLPSGFPDATPEVSSFAPPGLAWTVGSSEVDYGLGFTPTQLVALARTPASQGADPTAAKSVEALGSNATFAAVLRPPSCCSGKTPAAAPLTFGWGRKDSNGWLSLEIGDELLALLGLRSGP